MPVGVEEIQPKAITEAEEQPKIPVAPGKPVEQLVSGVQDGLVKLTELFELSPGITTEDKVKLSEIVQLYSELINENLGAAPGEAVKKTANNQFDKLPVEAGIANVIQAL